jgi:hypothetical protein
MRLGFGAVSLSTPGATRMAAPGVGICGARELIDAGGKYWRIILAGGRLVSVEGARVSSPRPSHAMRKINLTPFSINTRMVKKTNRKRGSGLLRAVRRIARARDRD